VRNEKTACLLVFVLSTLTNGKLHLSHFSLDLQIGYGFDILLNVWEPQDGLNWLSSGWPLFVS